MSSTMSTPIFQHLTKDNYETWKIYVEALLIKNDLWEYVSGEKPIPVALVGNQDSIDARNDWIKVDRKAKSEVVLAISSTELRHVRGCGTSREVWQKLASVYASKGRARKAVLLLLLKQLVLHKMSEDGDVRHHVNKFFDIVDQLGAMDIEVNQDLLSVMLLYSLPKSYEGFRRAVESREEILGVEALKVKILEKCEEGSNSARHGRTSQICGDHQLLNTFNGETNSRINLANQDSSEIKRTGTVNSSVSNGEQVHERNHETKGYRICLPESRKFIVARDATYVEDNVIPSWVKSHWDSARSTLTDFVPAGYVKDFVKQRNLDYTLSAGLVSQTSGSLLPMNEVQKKLAQFFKPRPGFAYSFDAIFDWISANVGDRVSDPQFVRALTTALCESATSRSGTSAKLKEEVLIQHDKFFQKYVNNKEENEMQCLYAIQAFVNELGHPKGLIWNIFGLLWEYDFISPESFITWQCSKEPSEQAGKVVAVASLTSFFVYLGEVEEESEES